MRVMTFNIQHCHEWLRNRINIPFFANAVKRMDADFCGLNEVRGKGALPGYTDQINKIGDTLGYNRYFGQTIRVGGVGPYGNAFVTRYPIITAKTVKIPDADDRSEPSNYESRGFISAIVDIDGVRVNFIVCHMGLSTAEQRNAVRAICETTDGIEGPMILMGDFNTTPDSGILDPLFERFSDTDALSLTPGGCTFTSYAPDRKIDYILYKDLKCTYAETVTEIMSDHFPIVADFEL